MNVHDTPYAEAGEGLARGNLGSLARVLKDHISTRYPIDPDTRNEVIQLAKRLMNSASERVQIAAVKVILLADQVNVRREANDLQEQGQDSLLATAKMRAALASPEARAAMAAVTAAVCAQSPQTPALTPISGPPALSPQPGEPPSTSASPAPLDTQSGPQVEPAPPQANGAPTTDYASYGGPVYRKENQPHLPPNPQ